VISDADDRLLLLLWQIMIIDPSQQEEIRYHDNRGAKKDGYGGGWMSEVGERNAEPEWSPKRTNYGGGGGDFDGNPFIEQGAV